MRDSELTGFWYQVMLDSYRELFPTLQSLKWLFQIGIFKFFLHVSMLSPGVLSGGLF